MKNFEYHRPGSIKEAIEIINRSDDGKYLAGGHTLIPVLKQRMAEHADLVDISTISDLRGINVKDNSIQIGAMTRHAEVAKSEPVRKNIPALSELAGGIGDPHVRNRGTIGGSLANNDPTADYPAAVLGLGAIIYTDRRQIAGDDFFVDMFETALEEAELIKAVEFPIPDRAIYLKFPNPASRYALVGVFVSQLNGQPRVAVTGAGPCVFRQREMEGALLKDFSSDALDDIVVPDDDLNEDFHASAEYRAHLVKILAKRAVDRLN